MMTNVGYGLVFLLTLTLQTALITSFDSPFRNFPLLLVAGIIILHERSLSLGVLWIIAAGCILESRGLGNGLVAASLAAALTATTLTTFVFAQRSFWALLSVAIGTAASYSLVRGIWLTGLAIVTREYVILTELLEQGLVLVIMTVFGVFLFGAYIRRFMKWSRNKFMHQDRVYEISFPN